MGKKFAVSAEVLRKLSIAIGGIPSMQSHWDDTTQPPQASTVTAEPKFESK
jgi:hypothetical protein